MVEKLSLLLNIDQYHSTEIAATKIRP